MENEIIFYLTGFGIGTALILGVKYLMELGD